MISDKRNLSTLCTEKSTEIRNRTTSTIVLRKKHIVTYSMKNGYFFLKSNDLPIFFLLIKLKTSKLFQFYIELADPLEVDLVGCRNNFLIFAKIKIIVFVPWHLFYNSKHVWNLLTARTVLLLKVNEKNRAICDFCQLLCVPNTET